MTEPKSPNFAPTRVVEVDLATGNVVSPFPPDRPLDEYRRVRAMARLGGRPIGMVDLVEVDGSNDEAVVDKVRADAWHQYAPVLVKAFVDAGLDAPQTPSDLSSYQPPDARELPGGTTPLVSVAVCTLHNDEAALDTVTRILANDYVNFEVVIVDNSDSLEPLAKKVAERFGGNKKVRHVLEPRRGLSRARNKGWEEAEGEIIVFTDDDVIVDRYWLSEIVASFKSEDNVGVVTGSIVPAELETPAQDWLEQYGGFNKGFERQVFDLDKNSRPGPLYPFDSGRFGSGANMALTREALVRLDGFANDLGAGTKAWGGEDIDILRRAITADFTIVYEPGALMWHRHRRSYDALRKQMYRYGIGLSATVTKWMLDPAVRSQVLRRIPLGLGHILQPGSKKNSSKAADYPKILSCLELAGLVVGPFAYLASRRNLRAVDNSTRNA